MKNLMFADYLGSIMWKNGNNELLD